MMAMTVRCEQFSQAQEVIVRADFERLLGMLPATGGLNTPLATWFGAANRVQLTGY